LYDVNPVPYGDELSLNINEDNNQISLELVLSIAPRFGLNKTQAMLFSNNILKTVKDNWEELAIKYGLSRAQIEGMRPAFNLCNSIVEQ
ncbi:MAG: type II toxin-antitoxin system HipA family toxin, partial [Erysipelotrichaceae bacterium]|nr:type II toxin-antitoxin system HipA family toxin [Erysipelotrichaceae bacterium]